MVDFIRNTTNVLDGRHEDYSLPDVKNKEKIFTPIQTIVR